MKKQFLAFIVCLSSFAANSDLPNWNNTFNNKHNKVSAAKVTQLAKKDLENLRQDFFRSKEVRQIILPIIKKYKKQGIDISFSTGVDFFDGKADKTSFTVEITKEGFNYSSSYDTFLFHSNRASVIKRLEQIVIGHIKMFNESEKISEVSDLLEKTKKKI